MDIFACNRFKRRSNGSCDETDFFCFFFCFDSGASCNHAFKISSDTFFFRASLTGVDADSDPDDDFLFFFVDESHETTIAYVSRSIYASKPPFLNFSTIYRRACSYVNTGRPITMLSTVHTVFTCPNECRRRIWLAHFSYKSLYVL